MGLINWVKGACAKTNIPLLKLKLSFFFYYSAWYATQPYVAVMQTQVVSYHHLAIMFAWSPLISIFGSIFIGFLGDKLGSYKGLTILFVIISAIWPFGVLWLHVDHHHFKSLPLNATGENSTIESELTDAVEQPHTLPSMLFFILLGLFTATVNNTLFESCGLTMCRKYGGDFAKQKLWGYVGMGLSPIICGVLVERLSDYLGYLDDSAAFYVGVVCTVIAVPIIMQLDVKVEKNKHSFFTTMKHVIKMADFNGFVLVEIIMGMMYSFHLVYRPVFATELHASKTLIGLLLTTTGIGTVVALSFIRIIIGKVGEANTLIISLLLFASRFQIFFYLENPMYLLLTELLEGFSGFTAIIAGSYYCAAESPPGMLGSVNGIMFAAIFGAGRGIGTSLGSKLIHWYDIRTTYKFLSYLAGGTAVVYFFLNHFYLRKIRAARKLAREKAVTADSIDVGGIENPAIELNEDDMISQSLELEDAKYRKNKNSMK